MSSMENQVKENGLYAFKLSYSDYVLYRKPRIGKSTLLWGKVPSCNDQFLFISCLDIYTNDTSTCASEHIRCNNGACVNATYNCMYGIDGYNFPIGCRDGTHLLDCGKLNYFFESIKLSRIIECNDEPFKRISKEYL